jgi:hypothetical protein
MKKLSLRIEPDDVRKRKNFLAQQQRDAQSGVIREYGKIVDVDEDVVSEREYELFRTLDVEQCAAWIRSYTLSIRRMRAAISGINRALKELQSVKRKAQANHAVHRSPASHKRVRKVQQD